jgi:branched-chain amino acid transport system ATP-binding protein
MRSRRSAFAPEAHEPMANTSAIEIRGLVRRYGRTDAVNGLSLNVAPGRCYGFFGRNGAGKTTTIRSIVGFTPPRAGRIVLDGEGIHDWPPYRIARRGVALVPQGRRIFAPLSVRENLLVGARAAGFTLERIFALFPRLAERQGQLAGTLSGGEQQMLALGRALLTNGSMLLLDEPSEGLAPIVVREIGRILERLKGERLSILLVEQNYHLALQVADRVYVMSRGQIVYEGRPDGLERDEAVKRRYLGVA